jgi:hypothetical protein
MPSATMSNRTIKDLIENGYSNCRQAWQQILNAASKKRSTQKYRLSDINIDADSLTAE